MDELLKTIILGAPNVAVAIVMLYWATKMVERSMAFTERLIDRLMAMIDKNEELQEQLAHQPANSQEETD